MYCSLKRASASALALATLAQPALHAEQLCYTANVPQTTTAWTTSVSIPKFDPALGVLRAVRFEISGQELGFAKAESLDSSPATVVLQFSCKLTLTRPDNSVIVITIPLASYSDPMTSYDGVFDFSGTSGVSHTGINASHTEVAVSLPPSTDLALFTGLAGNPGTITLPITASGTSFASGSGNLITQFNQTAGASVKVCYTYALDCNHNLVGDAQEIATGAVPDADANGIPDSCESVTTPYCFGDGPHNGGPDCPCSNVAPPTTGSGCVNSTGNGGLLTANGTPSVSNDTFTLTVTQLPPSTQGYFFSGTAALNGGHGAPFGDGLQCVGGQVQRIGKIYPGSATAIPFPGDPPLSVQFNILEGATRFYQVYYRNSLGPCGAGYSTTNGVYVVWSY